MYYSNNRSVNMKFKLVTMLFLSMMITGCDASTKPDLARDHVKISDILEKNKDKLSYINQLNPKEEYAVGIVVAQTPLKDRDLLKNKTVGDLINDYQKETGDNIPSGKIDAGDLKYKELTMKSANILYITSYSEKDRDLMKNYIAKNLFKTKEMEVIRNEKVSKIMEDAKK